MDKKIRRLSALAALAILVGAPTAPRAQDRLVLLTPHWEGIRHELFEGYRAVHKARTGRDIAIEHIDVGGGTSDMLRYVESEYKNKPGGIGVDLFFGGGTDPYDKLKKLGLLESYRPPDEILRHVAADIAGMPLYDAQDFTWFAPTMAGFGIVYNKAILDRAGLPVPRTWADLATPAMFGWVGSGDPRKSGATHMVYEIILQAYGWERGWRVITAMGANVRAFTSGAMQPTTDVAFGELACAQSIDFYARMQIATHGADRLGFVYPEGLTVINGDAIAILKGAPNLEWAQRFVDYLLSEDGQRRIAFKRGAPGGPERYDLGKFSVLPHLYETQREHLDLDTNPFQWKSDFRYDAELGSARWNVVNDLIGAEVIDTRPALVAAWRRAIEADGSDAAEPELERLAAPPVTADEALRIAESAEWKDDPGYRNRLLKEWSAHARAKYGADSAVQSLLMHLPGLIALAAGAAMFVYLRRRFRRPAPSARAAS